VEPHGSYLLLGDTDDVRVICTSLACGVASSALAFAAGGEIGVPVGIGMSVPTMGVAALEKMNVLMFSWCDHFQVVRVYAEWRFAHVVQMESI
jgi:hypothetical protein